MYYFWIGEVSQPSQLSLGGAPLWRQGRELDGLPLTTPPLGLVERRYPSKNNVEKLPRWFFHYFGTKGFTYSRKINIFGPKTAKFGPKYAFLVILGQILPFLHILSNARPKNNVNKVPRWVFRYVGNKAYDFSSKKKDFLPKNHQIWPKIGIFGQFEPGHAFGALLVGQLVGVARGLYLARHLFTL